MKVHKGSGFLVVFSFVLGFVKFISVQGFSGFGFGFRVCESS